MNQEIYLDNNATTKPLEEVCDAMVGVLGDGFGNPSSSHVAGDRGRDHLRNARQSLGQLLGADADRIVFTSSGTEANNMVLLSVAARERSQQCRIVTTSTEHSSILNMVKYLRGHGVDVAIVPVGREGIVDLDRLNREITPGTSLVSVQWVNNETGVIQPIERIGEMCRSRGVRFHTDACQTAGKLLMHLADEPIDLLTLTAHKVHGPQGVGAVYARDPSWLVPMFYGGPQENDLRAGTENLPGVVGFGTAAAVRVQQFDAVVAMLSRLRDEFEMCVRRLVPDLTINGDPGQRVCNTTNLCFHGVDGQALVARLDQEGIRCSQSSACTTQRPEPSYVLRAMGLSEDKAYSSVRFSFGVHNTEEEIEPAVVAIQDICVQLRSFADQIHNPYHTARV